ncbi:MAG: hypothetical protein OHK0011_20170 [Turneriella sp.]
MLRASLWIFAISTLDLWEQQMWPRVGKPPMSGEVRTRFDQRSVQLSNGGTAFDDAEGLADGAQGNSFVRDEMCPWVF